MPAKEPTWTPERVELLKIRFAAGLSCREIANDIGVSRNAVIGKISRLNLARENEPRRTVRKDDAKHRRTRSVPRLQYQLLRKLYDEAEPAADHETISNRPLDGLPYCVGHTRLAYRPRQRVAQR
jgi:GcrA cell cycle regulator